MSPSRSRLDSANTFDWTLRVGAAMCFVGHGAFGVMTKPAWVAYFAVVGIPPAAAFAWMPVIGSVDILMGCLVLFTPRPAIAVWMAGWGVWTALLRPLAGEPVWEALERAGNYGVPLALWLRMAPAATWRGFLAPGRFPALTPATARSVRLVLTASVVLLLVGHGALSLAGKPAFVYNLASVLPANAASVLPVLGWFELALAAAVGVRATVPLLLFVALWKVATEALFVSAGAPLWEWIERGGSYAAPVALAILIRVPRMTPRAPSDSTDDRDIDPGVAPETRSMRSTPSSARTRRRPTRGRIVSSGKGSSPRMWARSYPSQSPGAVRSSAPRLSRLHDVKDEEEAKPFVPVPEVGNRLHREPVREFVGQRVDGDARAVSLVGFEGVPHARRNGNQVCIGDGEAGDQPEERRREALGLAAERPRPRGGDVPLECPARTEPQPSRRRHLEPDRGHELQKPEGAGEGESPKRWHSRN